MYQYLKLGALKSLKIPIFLLGPNDTTALGNQRCIASMCVGRRLHALECKALRRWALPALAFQLGLACP